MAQLNDLLVTGDAKVLGKIQGIITKAEQDGNGNTITSIYATKTELTNGLAGKANSSHTHTKSQITDFPTSLPASDVYSWAKASSKPSYAWSEITSKPSTFTPSSHNHSSLDGSLTIAGTSAQTAQLAFSREGYNYITFPSGGSLALATSASGAGIVVGISSTGMYPYTDSAKTLGTSDKRWSNVYADTFTGALSGNATTATTATNVAWSGVTSKPSYYDAKAIKGITRSGTTFTYTCMDDTTGTFTQQDNNTTYSAATQSAQGLMSAADKKKLDGIASGANAYSLPTASSSTLGGVKTTSTVTSTSGLTACPIISGVPYYKDTNTTYSLSSFGVTATAAELNKLDGVTATTTEINYVDGVTSNIQTQLNGKAASSHNHSASNITKGTLSVARGGTGATTVDGILANLGLTDIISGCANVAVGSYKGTVAYNNSASTTAHPVSLTFGFTPKLFIVSESKSSSSQGAVYGICVYGSDRLIAFDYYYSGGVSFTPWSIDNVVWDTNSIAFGKGYSWDRCLSYSGSTYYYVAIG